MNRLIENCKKIIREYSNYRKHVIHNQTRNMIILTGLFTIYAVIAPILIKSVIPGAQNSVIRTQFTALIFVCGIPFIGFTILHLAKRISDPIKNTLYESFMAIICITTGAIYPCYSLLEISARGDYPDYTVFFIIALIMIITFVMNPFHFTVCFAICVYVNINFMQSSSLYISKQIYNLVIFSIAVIALYWVQVLSRLNAYMRGQQIIKLQKQREDFMVQLTHEMRTPLNAVLGKNQMIMADTAEENTRKLSNQINGSGRLLLSLINDILDQSKLESGKMNIIVSEYKSSHLIQEIGSIIDTMAEEHGLTFEKIISPKVPHFMYGDEIRIQQIVLNLLSNAIKYTPSGKVTLKIDFNATSNEEGTLEVSVIDTGIGIKEEDIPRLAQSFVRIDEELNKGIQGTGLGLSITTSLLNMMGAKLSIESVYGEGSTFSFALKQRYSHKVEAANDKYSSNINLYPDAKILIVDDNKINISILNGLLRKNQITADAAKSGAQCLEKVSQCDYDIIFLDHMMPDMDGIETLGKLRHEYKEQVKNSKIIALTANYDSNAKTTYESYGFDDYLAKPVEMKALNEVLNMYLSS